MEKGLEQDFPASIFLRDFDFETFAYTSIKNLIKFKMPVTKLVPWIISHFYRSHFFLLFKILMWRKFLPGSIHRLSVWLVLSSCPPLPGSCYNWFTGSPVLFCCVPGIILAIGLHLGKHNTSLPSSWNLYSCCRGRGMRIKFTSVNCLRCCYCSCAALSHVWHFVTSWTLACQPPLSMELSRLAYWIV